MAIRQEEMFSNQFTESIFDEEEEDRTMHEAIQMIPFEQRIAFILHTFFDVNLQEMNQLQLKNDEEIVSATSSSQRYKGSKTRENN